MSLIARIEAGTRGRRIAPSIVLCQCHRPTTVTVYSVGEALRYNDTRAPKGGVKLASAGRVRFVVKAQGADHE